MWKIQTAPVYGSRILPIAGADSISVVVLRGIGTLLNKKTAAIDFEVDLRLFWYHVLTHDPACRSLRRMRQEPITKAFIGYVN